jgi:hypothetical protein
VKTPASRFITYRLKESENKMTNINPFYTQKALDGVACEVKNASCLKEGTLLVGVQNGR